MVLIAITCIHQKMKFFFLTSFLTKFRRVFTASRKLVALFNIPDRDFSQKAPFSIARRQTCDVWLKFIFICSPSVLVIVCWFSSHNKQHQSYRSHGCLTVTKELKFLLMTTDYHCPSSLRHYLSHLL